MNNTITLDPNDLSQPNLHGYLLSAIAPRPICFASTINEKGEANLSPFIFFNVFSSNPPIMIFSPARRGRDNTTKHTYENVLKVKEVVINVVNHPIVEQMSLSSTEYGDGVNEFIKAGLSQVASEKIQPPRVGEAPVAFECVVDDVVQLGDGPGAGNLVIARVVMIHIRKEYLDASNKLDTKKLDLVARMGGSWYCRANGDALFEIPKPIRTKGIGVDQLPKSIKESIILTGNNLGRLGNQEALPSREDVLKMKESEAVQSILAKSDDAKRDLHLLAQTWLDENETETALKALMLCDLI